MHYQYISTGDIDIKTLETGFIPLARVSKMKNNFSKRFMYVH